MELSEEKQALAIAAIQRFFQEEREEEIGDLAATLLLDALVRAIGPAIYNQALGDSLVWMKDRMEMLEVDYLQLEQRDTGGK